MHYIDTLGSQLNNTCTFGTSRFVVKPKVSTAYTKDELDSLYEMELKITNTYSQTFLKLRLSGLCRIFRQTCVRFSNRVISFTNTITVAFYLAIRLRARHF